MTRITTLLSTAVTNHVRDVDRTLTETPRVFLFGLIVGISLTLFFAVLPFPVWVWGIPAAITGLEVLLMIAVWVRQRLGRRRGGQDRAS